MNKKYRHQSYTYFMFHISSCSVWIGLLILSRCVSEVQILIPSSDHELLNMVFIFLWMTITLWDHVQWRILHCNASLKLYKCVNLLKVNTLSCVQIEIGRGLLLLSINFSSLSTLKINQLTLNLIDYHFSLRAVRNYDKPTRILWRINKMRKKKRKRNLLILLSGKPQY